MDWAAFTPVEWDLLPGLAQAEAVAPRVYSLLEPLASDGQPGFIPVPPTVKAQLAEAYYHTAAFNAVLSRDLAGILEALGEAGVPIILLKGAALIKTLYADPAERPMNDLDLLVRRADIPQAVRALQAHGFQRLMDNYLRYHVFMFGSQAGGTSVELHWSLVLNPERFPELVDWFWRQSQPLEADCSGVRTLSPTAQLLYLTAHLGLQHHGKERLIWYYDLYLLVTRLGERIDWDELLRQAGQAGWCGVLRQTLLGTQERFGEDALPLPEGLLERLSSMAGQPSDQASTRVSSASDRVSIMGIKAWQSLPWADRLRMICGALFPRPAYLRWRYHPRPQWLWPLWYLRRWVELFSEKVEV